MENNDYKNSEIGFIPKDWDIEELQEHLIIKGRIGWKGLKKAEYLNEGYAIINGQQVLDGSVDWNNVGRISEDRYLESPEIMLQKEDILMTKDGTIGKIAFVRELKELATVASGVFVIRNNSDKITQRFLYQYFHSHYFKHLVQSRIEGSVIPHLYQKDIQKLAVPLPPVREQEEIAKILFDIDDKIDLNKKINKNLEELGQTLFKRWFVNFDFPNEQGEPYKSSGGEMIESELGMIPKGWEVSSFKKLVKVIDNRGKTPPLENKKTKFPIIDVKALSGENRIIDYSNCMKFVSEETYNHWFRSGHPQKEDILMSTVGSLAQIKIFYGNIGSIAQNVVAFRPQSISTYYLYQYMLFFKNELIQYNIGSVQPSIKIPHILRHNILIPNNKEIQNFFRIMKNFTKLIYDNSLENNTLFELKKILLPRLMSGEIRIK